MLTFLVLLACSTGIVDLGNSDILAQPDDTVECGPGTHDEGGLCVPNDDTGAVDDTASIDDTAVTETGEKTGDTGDTGDTGEVVDTAVEPSACSDGTEDVSLEGAVFCMVPTMTLEEFSNPVSGHVFAEACSDGWVVCDDTTWRASNGDCAADFSFGAILDNPDGDGTNSCVVAHNPPTGAECSSDYTGYEAFGNGTCELQLPPDGIEVGELYGLVGRNSGATSGGFDQLGVACCLDE
jgi:hypothetical protein